MERIVYKYSYSSLQYAIFERYLEWFENNPDEDNSDYIDNEWNRIWDNISLSTEIILKENQQNGNDRYIVTLHKIDNIKDYGIIKGIELIQYGYPDNYIITAKTNKEYIIFNRLSPEYKDFYTKNGIKDFLAFFNRELNLNNIIENISCE